MNSFTGRVLRITQGVLLLVIALNAFAGGYYGISGAEGVPLEWLDGSPFKNYFIPGLALMIVVGGCSLAAAILVFRNSRFSGRASLLCGIVILIWLTVQVSIIGYVSWMQPATAIAAVLVIILSSKLNRHVD